MLEKGLDENVADKIGEFVKYKTKSALDLLLDTNLSENELAKQGLEELKLLYSYLEIFGIDTIVEFDMSLARGLDYYTGVIYEVVVEGEDVGSIAAGGRYDNLVGMFSGKPVPCVGVSIGVERVFAILTKRELKLDGGVKVMVVSPDGHLRERMAITKMLWDQGIETEFAYKDKPKIKSQLSGCDKDGIPVAVIVGKKEIEQGGVIVKVLETKIETFVKLDELSETLKNMFNQ
jgi:histidyl-tRNA synthetase